MESIAVFCASGIGNNPIYRDVAYEFGKYLAKKGKRLVYGGSQLGLMGAVADGVLDGGGKAIGVLPRFMSNKEIAHLNLSELIMVDSMHERKLKMHELSDAVVTLPGGFGTFEELFEMLTWAQLGLHNKPIGILNVEGYYDHLMEMINHMLSEGLLKSENESLLITSSNQEELIEMMEKRGGGDENKELARERS
jgi:uncharacterized protein (TIGR00730 family)